MKSLGNIRRAFAPWTDPSAKPFIAFKNVTKRFGNFTAVNDLSLNIYHREFFALLGASGCGKSPALNSRHQARSSSTAPISPGRRPTSGRST